MVFWLFRGATYLILACGAAVFLNIIVKGSHTVFKAEAVGSPGTELEFAL